ncbi:MAG: RusA family crossover junction endodeoxyribonuclease [Elusimicrobiota bacterium]|jgi:Holliday junction resolvase RusA-like endonuclease|nr:RusA family crossover junction endodeoxyribonuclease [Elusimicrobiota bacterium]
MLISFTVYGEPVAKGRPRFSTRGGFGRTYTPAKTAQAEKNFLAQAIKFKPETPIETAVNIKMRIFRQPPKSLSKKKLQEIENCEHFPTTRPDLDNYMKLIFDAMNGVFWRDDSQITALYAGKFYDKTPRIEIEIAY